MSYLEDNNIFISKPLLKLYFDNGLGLYILNSYTYRFFPKFYGSIKKDYWELGFYFAGYIFEIMWNKYFKVIK